MQFIKTNSYDKFQSISYKQTRVLHMVIRFFFSYFLHFLLGNLFIARKTKILLCPCLEMTNILVPRRTFYDFPFDCYCETDDLKKIENYFFQSFKIHKQE